MSSKDDIGDGYIEARGRLITKACEAEHKLNKNSALYINILTSSSLRVIENFNYCEQVVTDLNSKDAVVGDFGGFVFEGGKTFDPSKTRGGL